MSVEFFVSFHKFLSILFSFSLLYWRSYNFSTQFLVQYPCLCCQIRDLGPKSGFSAFIRDLILVFSYVKIFIWDQIRHFQNFLGDLSKVRIWQHWSLPQLARVQLLLETENGVSCKNNCWVNSPNSQTVDRNMQKSVENGLNFTTFQLSIWLSEECLIKIEIQGKIWNFGKIESLQKHPKKPECGW